MLWSWMPPCRRVRAVDAHPHDPTVTALGCCRWPLAPARRAARSKAHGNRDPWRLITSTMLNLPSSDTGAAIRRFTKSAKKAVDLKINPVAVRIFYMPVPAWRRVFKFGNLAASQVHSRFRSRGTAGGVAWKPRFPSALFFVRSPSGKPQ